MRVPSRFATVLGVLPYGVHSGIVFEDYGSSLRDLLVTQESSLRRHVPEIAKQILQGLECECFDEAWEFTRLLMPAQIYTASS